MHKKVCRLGLLLPALLFGINLFAQDVDQRPEMADLLRSNGKIYVVVAVLVTILAGLFFYLIRLDRKIGRLEKEVK
jgi:CcmD family protein